MSLNNILDKKQYVFKLIFLLLHKKRKNKMRKKRSLLLAPLVITCCFSITLIINFRQGKHNIRSKITQALQESITIDYHKRFFQNNIYIPEPLGRKIKGIKIAVGEKNENIIFKDSIDEQTAHQLVDQYMFAQFTPVIPNDFNVIFKEKLKEKGINGKTGIIYRHNGIPQYSDNDSVSAHSALRTHIKMLDIKNTVSVQGWVDYSWNTLLKHTDTKNLWIILTGYILTVVLLKKKKTKIAESPIVKEENLEYCEIGKIKLDLKKRLLYINETNRPISSMDFDLLQMFLEAPDHYLSREDIKQAFWPKEDSADDKINSHITSLRSKIKDLEEYSIQRIKGKGYYLVVP